MSIPKLPIGTIESIVTENIIHPNDVMKWQADRSHGAGNIFLGYVRNINLGKEVQCVHYEAYQKLAENTFTQIAKEAQNKWGNDTTILVIHRVGKVEIGELSIAIFVTTRHRDESYLASRYIIEEIKTRAPIWKKEVYTDHETEWVRGHALCTHKKREVENHENAKTCTHSGHHTHGR